MAFDIENNAASDLSGIATKIASHIDAGDAYLFEFFTNGTFAGDTPDAHVRQWVGVFQTSS